MTTQQQPSAIARALTTAPLALRAWARTTATCASTWAAGIATTWRLCRLHVTGQLEGLRLANDTPDYDDPTEHWPTCVDHGPTAEGWVAPVVDTPDPAEGADTDEWLELHDGRLVTMQALSRMQPEQLVQFLDRADLDRLEHR